MKSIFTRSRATSTSATSSAFKRHVHGRGITLLAVGCLLIPFLTGCGGSSNSFSALERDLAQALARFENAEANFSSSATYDQLIVNAGWLDRMAEQVGAIERIEAKAISMGSEPIPEIREEIAQRFRRRLATLQSDAEFLDAISQLEIARIWSEI